MGPVPPCGPTGPTGPTANDVPDVVRAVLAAFETVDDPHARLDAARARVALLSDADGIARTDAAIEAVWDEAAALAAVRQAEGAGAPSNFPTDDRKPDRTPPFAAVQN